MCICVGWCEVILCEIWASVGIQTHWPTLWAVEDTVSLSGLSLCFCKSQRSIKSCCKYFNVLSMIASEENHTHAQRVSYSFDLIRGNCKTLDIKVNVHTWCLIITDCIYTFLYKTFTFICALYKQKKKNSSIQHIFKGEVWQYILGPYHTEQCIELCIYQKWKQIYL